MSNLSNRLRKVAHILDLQKTAKDRWVQDAIQRPGRLHKYFGIPEDETIPREKIDKEISRLHKKKEDKGSLSKNETSLLRALQLAKRLKKMSSSY